MVSKLLSARGTVDIDERTNTLIIKDITSVIDEATALVKAIDTQTPQVLIESKIVEANLDFSRELGSVWGFGSQPLRGRVRRLERRRGRTSAGTTSASTTTRCSGLDDASTTSSVSNPITSDAQRPGEPRRLPARREASTSSVQLQAAESNGEGKVISSPRVVTLDNREADDRAGRVDPVPDLRERRRPARVHRRGAVARRDAAHHGGPEHHHEDRGDSATRRTTASRRRPARRPSPRTRRRPRRS